MGSRNHTYFSTGSSPNESTQKYTKFLFENKIQNYKNIQLFLGKRKGTRKLYKCWEMLVANKLCTLKLQYTEVLYKVNYFDSNYIFLQ